MGRSQEFTVESAQVGQQGPLEVGGFGDFSGRKGDN